MVFYRILSLVASAAFILLSLFYLRRNKSYKKIEEDLLKSKQHLIRLNLLRDSMLEISQAVVGTENPKDLYELILSKAISAIPNANVGSVLILGKDGLLRSFSQQGYDKEKIEQFALPLEETILWKYTKGKIKNTEIINDVSQIEDLNIQPLTIDTDEWQINSTLAVPIFVEKEVMGILHIDSKEINAFSKDDWTSMEYIRSNIEVALQKFFLYTKMVRLSRFDGLTEAYNRPFFMEQFDRILNNAERYKQNFAIVIFDINDLKRINDTKGHIAGDRVLQAFTKTTMNNIRKTDIFSRWGGDEFMGLFYQISKEEISEKIEKIKKSLEEKPVISEKEEIFISFSHGCAFYPDEGKNFDELLKVADNKMYINKREMKGKRNG